MPKTPVYLKHQERRREDVRAGGHEAAMIRAGDSHAPAVRGVPLEWEDTPEPCRRVYQREAEVKVVDERLLYKPKAQRRLIF